MFPFRQANCLQCPKVAGHFAAFVIYYIAIALPYVCFWKWCWASASALLARGRDYDMFAGMQQVMGVFINQCKARMHWGKAGWPQWEPCFDVRTWPAC